MGCIAGMGYSLLRDIYPEELRKNLGMNQEDFAKAIKVSRQTVSSIETGKYNPSLELAFIISNYFNKSIEEIFIYERSKTYEKT